MEHPHLACSLIGAAIDVHRALGPGLLESSYQACLAYELAQRGVPFQRERGLHVRYKGVDVECGYRLDFLIGEEVVVEVKSVEALAPIHTAQILTYLKLGGWKLGYLLNFNVPLMKHGIKRVIL